MIDELDPKYFNRKGRRAEVAIQRKSASFDRKYKAREHAKLQREQRAEGLAYRIAKIKRNIPVIKAFQKKHPKLKKQFKLENKALGI